MKSLGIGLAVAVASLYALLGGASMASAGTGSISGTVRDATPSHGGLASIRVCADELESGGEIGSCGQTDANGNYALSALKAGPWAVRFRAPKGVNLVRQWYQGAVVFPDALQLAVGSGSISGIDAEMHEGGTITGSVTSEESGLPIAGLEVCAEADGGLIGECTVTEGTGEYTLTGLPGGFEYQVEFFSLGSQDYLTRHYNEKEGLNNWDRVPVTVGSTASGIDAVMKTGAQIEGHVSEVGTGKPVAGLNICALDFEPTNSREEEFEQCGHSDASGSLRDPGACRGNLHRRLRPQL